MYRTKIYVEKTSKDNCFWFNRIPCVLIDCNLDEAMRACSDLIFESVMHIWQPDICVDFIDGKYVRVKCDNPFEHFDMHLRYDSALIHYVIAHIDENDPGFLSFIDDLVDNILASFVLVVRRSDGSFSVLTTQFDKIHDGKKYQDVFFPGFDNE